ncbi:carboxypeptidase-like regulatory domain-containing protein [Aeoliella sp.]|uniref:carboxypeptidase-like regulatory domain-containing protein n=1 Tax=Aeoliella sp. TaxID=2795800 RepID=UPI003CCC1EBB
MRVENPSLIMVVRDALACAVALAILPLVGCGEPRVVNINPQFTIDGQPLQEASVTFVRSDESGGRAAFGVTDEKGVAKLTTYSPNDGVPPGKYNVVVIKAPENAHTYEAVQVDADSPEEVLRKSSMNLKQEARMKRVRSVLPEQYSDPGTTPLTCTVTGSSEDPAFELVSK